MRCVLSMAVALSVAACANAASTPYIETKGDDIVMGVPAGKNLLVQQLDSDGQPQGAPVPVITATELLEYKEEAAATLSNTLKEAMEQQMETIVLNYLRAKDATATYETKGNVADLQTKLQGLATSLEQLATKVDNPTAVLIKCPRAAKPDNGDVEEPAEPIAGSTAEFSCKAGYKLKGPKIATCLSTGKFSATPKCDSLGPLGSEAENPASSCRAIWEARSKTETLKSGGYWLTVSSSKVYCDMRTKTDTGKSGWTLCGKYDDARAGPRYLSQGFGRAAVSVSDMGDLSTFTARQQKWSSVDCRDVIKGQGLYMMHASTNAPKPDVVFDQLRFTNIFQETATDPTNLFDISHQDKGTCLTGTKNAPVKTWNLAWEPLTSNVSSTLAQPNDKWPEIQVYPNSGECLVGDGHHFCSFDRAGTRYSNLGLGTLGVGKAGCSGSGGDSVYWAWMSDDHACASGAKYLIGTGCDRISKTVPPAIGTPGRRYNYLFMY